jgi:Family of unknown function (DUF6719)
MTACSILLGGFALAAVAIPAMAEQVSRERDIVDLRLGQRILVDDGSCPPGEIKEVSGARMTATGILRVQKCIPRLGPKKKQVHFVSSSWEPAPPSGNRSTDANRRTRAYFGFPEISLANGPKSVH